MFLTTFTCLTVVKNIVFLKISLFDISLTNSTLFLSAGLLNKNLFSNKYFKLVLLLFIMFLSLELFIFWFNLFVRPETLPIVEPVSSGPLPVKNLEQPVLSEPLPVKSLENSTSISDSTSTSDSTSSLPRKNCFKIVFEKSVNGFISLPGEIQLIACLFVGMIPQMIYHTLTK